MRWWILAAAAALVCCGLAGPAWAQAPAPAGFGAPDYAPPGAFVPPGVGVVTDGPQAVLPGVTPRETVAAAALVPPNPWPYRTYHPFHPIYCRTCYGGASCHNRGKGGCAGGDCAGGNCAAGSCGGVSLAGSECACHANPVSTCRKCGLIGRILFYECKRLGCGGKGGEGCRDHGNLCGDCGGCGDCCGCECDGHKGPLAKFRSRPLGGYASMTGPWVSRYNCYGWREGPLNYYGTCCGCYESYLFGMFDDRGPLNQGRYEPGAFDAALAAPEGALPTVVEAVPAEVAPGRLPVEQPGVNDAFDDASPVPPVEGVDGDEGFSVPRF